MRRRREREWNQRWGDLATYNSEVARGLMHTPEWKRKMAEQQKAYNQEVFPSGVQGR